MKYNNITTEKEKYADLRYYSNYINGRQIEYVKIDRELRKLGITRQMKGCAYPVADIEVSGWTSHAEKRLTTAEVSKQEALDWKNRAIVMLQKYPAPETQYNFYCDDGVLGINAMRHEVTTIIAKERFKEDTIKILVVSKKWLKT